MHYNKTTFLPKKVTKKIIDKASEFTQFNLYNIELKSDMEDSD